MSLEELLHNLKALLKEIEEFQSADEQEGLEIMPLRQAVGNLRAAITNLTKYRATRRQQLEART